MTGTLTFTDFLHPVRLKWSNLAQEWGGIVTKHVETIEAAFPLL